MYRESTRWNRDGLNCQRNAPLRRLLVERSNCATPSVSPRAPGSMLADAISAESQIAASALRSVLRRCENAADTMRANNSGSSIAGARASSGRRRTTAESTFGEGRNAPGGTFTSLAISNCASSRSRRRRRDGPVPSGPRILYAADVQVGATLNRARGTAAASDVVRQVADDAQVGASVA